MPRVFFITGTSRGLGQAFAQAFLDAGEHVVATARNPSDLSFTGTTADNYLPLKLDVTSSTDIETAFDAALQKFGRIDVVINNAAYGLVGVLETLTDAQIRSQFDTNFFSVATIMRRSLKIMRTQSPPGGRILQVSSMAAFVGFPMVSAMCASKCAMDSLTDAVRQELKPEWGISIVNLKPGALKTDAHVRSMVFGETEVPEYSHLNAKAWVDSLSELPVIDLEKVAQAVYAVSKMEKPPFNVVLGDHVNALAREKVKKMEEMLNQDDLLDIWG